MAPSPYPLNTKALAFSFPKCSAIDPCMAEVDQSSLVSFRMGHLDMIERTISRLSGHSATVKNFSLTVFIAVLTLGLSQDEPLLLCLAGLVPLLFMFIDAYYLGVERSFRALYEAVVERPLADAPSIGMNSGRPASRLALGSYSVWPFYLFQFATAGAAYMMRSLM